MTLEQLRTFLAVLEHGGFSNAARALGVRQSTVSFHVRSLEQAAGARLLDRRATGVVATAAGRRLRRVAQRMLALHDEALAELRAEATGETGHVTIAASTIPGEYLLPPLLARFRREHPAVSLRMDVMDSRRAIDALLAEACDFAVVGSRLHDRRLTFATFARDEILVVGPAPNPFAPRGRLTRAGLRRVPLVLREEGSGTQASVHAVFDPEGAAGRPAGLRVGSSESVRRCVREGLGLGFLSRHAVAEDLAAGRLTRVAVPGFPVRRRFVAARRRGRTPSAAADGLWKFLIRNTR